MSATVNDTPKPAIVAASTPNDVIIAAANDPALKAALIQAFGPQLAEAQKSPWGMAAGALVGFLGTHYGVSLDPAAQMLAAGVLAILGGDIWQWSSAKLRPVATKGTPA